MDKQEKAKWYTLTELSRGSGAFDVGKRYKCVKTSGSFFVINKIYTCNGRGVVFDEREDCHAYGCDNTMFELVNEPKIYWNGVGKPKVGEIVNVKLDSDGLTLAAGSIGYVGQAFGNDVYVVQLPSRVVIVGIEVIKPIDTRTEKEKAIDELFGNMEYSSESRDWVSQAYDKWVGDKK